MTGSMKVHLYQVVPLARTRPYEEVLREISLMGFEDRTKLVSQAEMRLEKGTLAPAALNIGTSWLLDFTKGRTNGPGRMRRDSAIVGFDMGADEAFGEETAALYDPGSKHLLVQYNHHGPRPGSIEEYINTFLVDSAGFQLQVKVDQTAETRLARKEVIKKVVFKIAPPRMSSSMRRSNVSVNRAFDVGEDLGAEWIEVTVSGGRNALNFSKATAMVRSLMGIRDEGGQAGGAIDGLTVHAKDDDDQTTEALNLLTPKVEVEIDGLELGNDRRYTRKSRWNALVRARTEWARLLR